MPTSLSDQLALFGLSDKEQTIFLILVKHQWQTVLQLARLSTIKRSSIYRILESLEQKGLIEVQVDHKTTYYQASSPQSFESLAIHDAQRIKQMQAALPDLHLQLQLLAKIQPHSQTAVHFYRGIHGIRTLEWRTCAYPNSEMLIFGTNQWSNVMGFDFAERIRQERVEKNIHLRELLNPKTLTKESINGTWTNNLIFLQQHYHGRLIEPQILSITTEIIILPDSLTIFSFQANEMVGIELESAMLANMLKQFFEMIWGQAKELPQPPRH